MDIPRITVNGMPSLYRHCYVKQHLRSFRRRGSSVQLQRRGQQQGLDTPVFRDVLVYLTK